MLQEGSPILIEVTAAKLGVSVYGCMSAKSSGCFVLAIQIRKAVSDQVVRVRYKDVADLILRSLGKFPFEQFFEIKL